MFERGDKVCFKCDKPFYDDDFWAEPEPYTIHYLSNDGQTARLIRDDDLNRFDGRGFDVPVSQLHKF